MAKVWEPLSNPLESTRVFEILPAEPGTLLSLQLREVKLSDDVQYDAISYTRGDAAVIVVVARKKSHKTRTNYPRLFSFDTELLLVATR